MSIFFGRNSEESCIDPVTFENRTGFFTDRLIRVFIYLMNKGIHPDTFYLNPRHETEIKLQLGTSPGINEYYIYSPGGKVQLVFSGNRQDAS